MTSPTPGTGQAQSCAECGTRGEPGQSFCDACGAVLGWSGTPARSATGAARSESADRAHTSGTPSDTSAGSDAGRATSQAQADGARTADATPDRPAPAPAAATAAATATATGHPSPEASPSSSAAAPAPTNAERDAAGNEPGWDASSLPGAGTGTARTAHDTTQAGATPATVLASEAQTRPQPQAQAPAQAQPSAPHPHPGDEDPTTPLPTHPSPAPPTSPAPTPPPSPSPSAADRARSLLVPVADPEHRAPAEPAVAPVLPGRPDVQRPQVRAPQPEFGAEGGVPCPWCGTPTRPDRHFCARCAMPMAGRTEAPARLPWWRRVLTGRNTETPWAGDRPRLRRGFGQILSWLVGALVLTLIVTLAFQADDAYQATRDHFAKRASVVPDSFKASRSFPGHKPQLAFDTYSNTWWGPGVTQSGEGEWIEARFEEPTRLLDVVITPGVSKNADQRAESARPHRIEAKITAPDGSVSTKTLTLDQSAGGQRRKFRVGAAETVRFTLLSAYGADAKKQVAIAEIEFFGRSNGGS
ncbi:NADase-type glycan-binding domain-containing protein [Streptomyces akebiae]|uniref:Zinc ribbon domain-containing protein n=1 Tax=Streptomyces akebiae TaxID=2865673 RepID=A0ABX8XNA1_9ACTN|nr:zinc ribbon domain-containing protein [Streptomyces akebiae]QYX77410.1 zinc ribbon domain-containing protein [Streptomyces akebiae]